MEKKRKPLELGRYVGIKQNLISDRPDSFRLQLRLRDESGASACVVLFLRILTSLRYSVTRSWIKKESHVSVVKFKQNAKNNRGYINYILHFHAIFVNVFH